MNWSHAPKNWTEFPNECLYYLFPGALFHLVVFILTFVGIALIRLVSARRPRYSTAFVFHVFLLVTGMVANGIWSSVVWGKLYWSVDYISDFSVFIPLVRNQVEGSWGPDQESALNGISLTQLNLVWSVFALGAWSLAALATRRHQAAR